MPDVHAKLSASGSHIWLNCTPSVKMSEGIPNKNTAYTLEGTTAHSLAEVTINHKTGAIGYDKYSREVERISESEFFSAEMTGYIESYADWVVETFNAIQSEDKELLTEQRLDFSAWVPGGFGTGDVVIIADGELTVIDLKYGKGVPVSAVDNPQLMLYALGAYDSFSLSNDIENVRMIINQPRLDSISDFTMPVDALLRWGEEYVKPLAEKAMKGEGEAAPGEHCRFCRVKATCMARADEALQLIELHKWQEARSLSDTDIGDILSKADRIKSWIEDVKDYAQSEALEGRQWPGWKLVEGKSNRKYTDPKEVEKKLIEAGFDRAVLYKDPELLGLTAMEKVVGGKKKLETICKGLIIKPQGAPTLVPESDKRPAINAVDFDDD